MSLRVCIPVNGQPIRNIDGSLLRITILFETLIWGRFGVKSIAVYVIILDRAQVLYIEFVKIIASPKWANYAMKNTNYAGQLMHTKNH